MADIPKPRQARPSGVQPTGALAPYDIAQTEDVGQGLQNLGASVFNIGEDLYNKEADREFTEFTMKRENAYNQALNTALGLRRDETGKTITVEPDAIPRLYQGLLESFEKDLPKNAEARRRLQIWEISQVPAWNQKIKSAQERRYDEKYDVMIQSRIETLMKEADKDRAEVIIADINDQRRMHQGWGDSADVESMKLRDAWEYQAWLNKALVDPERVLKNINVEGGKYHIRGIDGLPALDDAGKVQAIRNNAKGMLAQLDEARQQRAQAFEDDVTKRLIGGEYTVNGESIRELIRNNPDLTAAARRTLSNFYNARIAGAGKKYTDEEKFAAYVEIDREKDPEKKMELLFKHVNGIGSAKAESIYNSMTDPDDVMKDPFYEEWDKRIDTLFIDNKGDVPKDKIPEFAQMKESLKDVAREAGKDYSKAQKQIETLTEKPKEEKAKSIWSRIWGPVIVKRAPYPGTESLYGIETAPKGLESVWDELNREERNTAISATQRGVTAKEIIEILNGK